MKLEGVPPKQGEEGSEAFIRSRLKAELKIEEIDTELKTANSKEEVLRIIEKFRDNGRVHKPKKKNYSRPGNLPLEDIFEAWFNKPAKRPRKRESSYIKQKKKVLSNFIEFIKNRDPKIQYTHEITPLHCEQFMRAEEERGITAATYNKNLSGLKTMFRAIAFRAGISKNPFEEIPEQTEDVVNRIPFNDSQLRCIYSAAEKDQLAGPVVITGICTALRQGDCCNLDWEKIDLESNTILTKTHKTDTDVPIPIFPPLRKLLLKLGPKKSGPVFPEQAKIYAARPDSISYRAVKLIRESISSIDTEFQAQKKRKRGLRKASIHDFHSLRTTWVTIAIMSGVSKSLVKLVVGHKDYEMITKHYFKPLEGDMVNMLKEKMASIAGLGGIEEIVQEPPSAILTKIISLVSTMKEENVSETREEAIQLLNQLKQASGL